MDDNVQHLRRVAVAVAVAKVRPRALDLANPLGQSGGKPSRDGGDFAIHLLARRGNVVKNSPDLLDHNLMVKGLGQNIHGAKRPISRYFDGLSLRRQKYYRRVAETRRLAQQSQRGRTVHVGHHDVDNYQIGREFGRHG
jgi:hypothetical protein